MAGTIVSDTATQIVATSPPGNGSVDVTVTTADGTSTTLAADQFTFVAANSATLSGIVFDDLSGNGNFETGDAPLSGVILTLSGTDSQGNSLVPLNVKTASDGSYQFTKRPGDLCSHKGPAHGSG